MYLLYKHAVRNYVVQTVNINIIIRYTIWTLVWKVPSHVAAISPADYVTFIPQTRNAKYNEEIIRFLSPTRHDTQHTQLSHLKVAMPSVLTCCSLATNILQQNTSQLLLTRGHLFLASVKARGADGRTDGSACYVREMSRVVLVRRSAIGIAAHVTRS